MFNKTKRQVTKLTFSKRLVLAILIIAEFDVQLTYILAFFDKQIAETLGVAIVTEILGTIIAYLCKSYFETKAEKKQQLEEDKFKYFKQTEEGIYNAEEECSP